MKRIESIVAEKQAKYKPSTHNSSSHKEDSALNCIVGTLKEADNEDSVPSDKVSTVKETDKEDPFDPGTSQSVDSFDIVANRQLSVSDDAGRENTPAHEVAVDERRDAKMD